MESGGHVFVLYTDGETEQQEKAEMAAMSKIPQDGKPHLLAFQVPYEAQLDISDSLGTDYLKSLNAYQPHEGGMKGQRGFNGIVDDGLILKGAWFIPAQYRAWRPVQVSIGVEQQGGEDAGHYLVTFRKPSFAMVSPLPDLIEMGPKNEQDILAAERTVRRPIEQREGDWAAVLQGLQDDLSADADDERTEGQIYDEAQTYYEMYDALNHLGRHEEALEYLRKATGEQYRPESYPGNAIEKAVEKEGLK